MKFKLLIPLIILAIILAGCGTDGMSDSVSLLDHNGEEVTFPQENPTLFFFITTYTWSHCQQQLVQLHENLDVLEGLEVNAYIISGDTPEQQVQLYDALKEEYGESLPFVSDPKLEIVDRFNMKNGNTPYRGYGMLNTDGTVVFNVADDLWGEQLTKTMDKVNEEYEKLSGK